MNMNTYMITTIVILAIGVYGFPVYDSDEPIAMMKERVYRTDSTEVYYWGDFSECSRTCDGGSMYRYKICFNGTLDAYRRCDMEYFECNKQRCDDPFRGTTFTECTVPCGGGFRHRTSTEGKVHTIRCNTQLCEHKQGTCEADIIFVMDSSATIGDNDFYNIKQFSMDIVSALPISNRFAHVGAISFSTKVYKNINLGDLPDKKSNHEELWKIPYLAGMTNTADALMEMREMSRLYSKSNKTQVAIVLTDGISNIDHQRTLKEAKLAHNDGISVIVIGIGLTNTNGAEDEMKGIASNDASYYSVPNVGAIMDITDIIVRDTCSKPKVTCGQCHYSECTAECEQEGVVQGSRTCTTVYKKVTTTEVQSCAQKNCVGKCKITTSTVKTTTMLTTPSPFGVDCDKCDFSNGQVWRPDVFNCHGFYVCQKTGVEGVYRITRMTCGDLYWNQDIVTCVRHPQAGCNAAASPRPTVKNTGTTQAPFCTYKTNPKNPRQFKPKTGDSDYQTCPPRMHFDDSNSVCTCLPDSGHLDPCDNHMLLHFPYDSHLNDVTCNKALSSLVGDKVVLVKDSVRGRVAKFNGHGYLEVPFIRKYFAGNTVNEFTVAYFFKATGKNTNSRVAIVSNGDCKEESTFESGYTTGRVYYQARSTSSAVNEQSSFKVIVNTWYHVAWVYDGHHVMLYVDGAVVNSKALTGGLLNTDVPMDVGARCGEFYHTGLVDELQVYHQRLSASSVKVLSRQ